jgi:hypothetical protein
LEELASTFLKPITLPNVEADRAAQGCVTVTLKLLQAANYAVSRSDMSSGQQIVVSQYAAKIAAKLS